MHKVALSLVPEHIASSVQKIEDNPVREVNALQALALWWRDSFVVTGPGIESFPYADIDIVGVEVTTTALISCNSTLSVITWFFLLTWPTLFAF